LPHVTGAVWVRFASPISAWATASAFTTSDRAASAGDLAAAQFLSVGRGERACIGRGWSGRPRREGAHHPSGRAEERDRARPLTRFIYVIGPQQGLQKVGLGTDPQLRLAALQTGSPFDLQIHVGVQVPFAEAHTIERRAHRLLARSRVPREWFQTSPCEAIGAVHLAAAPAMARTGQQRPEVVTLPLFNFRDHARTDLLESCALWHPASRSRRGRHH
jgi:hypothetical protein